MSSERDRAIDNPYEPPSDPPDVAMIERRRGSLPWWLRPGGTPSIVAALPFYIVLLIAIVVAFLLPIIQWLWQ